MYQKTQINCFVQPHITQLEDCQDIWWGSNASGNIHRLTDNEKLVSSGLLAMLAQRLEVEKLTNGHTPASKHNLMTRPFLLRWPCLPIGSQQTSKCTAQKQPSSSKTASKKKPLTNSDDHPRTPQNSPT